MLGIEKYQTEDFISYLNSSGLFRCAILVMIYPVNLITPDLILSYLILLSVSEFAYTFFFQ